MLRKAKVINTSVNSLSDEAIEFAKSWARVNNIAVMDEIFWGDFILGATLWGIYCGSIGEQ